MKKTKGLIILETNVDDATPEELSYSIEKLMEEGAMDAYIIPIIMKKGRLGFLLRALCREELSEKIAKLITQETGSLGVRVLEVKERYEVEREIAEVGFEINGEKETCRVKISEVSAKPEFEDLKRISKKHKIPLRKLREKVLEKLKASFQN